MNLVVHGDRLPMSGVVVLLLDVGQVLRVVALRIQKMPKIDTLDALGDEMTSILNTL